MPSRSSRAAPHPAAAAELGNYLLSPEVEAALASGAGAQIPLLPSTQTQARVETPRTVHAMAVDFEVAAKLWDQVAGFLADQFGGD